MNLYFAFQKSEKLNIEQSISHSTTITTSCPYTCNCQRGDDGFKTAVIAKKRSQHIHIFNAKKSLFFIQTGKTG